MNPYRTRMFWFLIGSMALVIFLSLQGCGLDQKIKNDAKDVYHNTVGYSNWTGFCPANFDPAADPKYIPCCKLFSPSSMRYIDCEDRATSWCNRYTSDETKFHDCVALVEDGKVPQ